MSKKIVKKYTHKAGAITKSEVSEQKAKDKDVLRLAKEQSRFKRLVILSKNFLTGETIKTVIEPLKHNSK